jgi:hypothetical protein
MKEALFFGLLLLTSALEARPEHALDPRAVFAKNDHNGRLANTKITELGIIRTKGVRYSVYYLEFVNPISHHGMQQIAVIRNGKEFSGSYQCSLGVDQYGGAKLTVGKDRLTVRLYDGVNRPSLPANQYTFVIRFDAKGPTKNKYFCGEGSGWQDSI